jgi:hypothetical protein
MECPLSDDRMDMWMEVGGEAPECLNRRDSADPRTPVIDGLAENCLDALMGTTGQQGQEPTIPLEQSAYSLRDREHHMSMGDRRQNLFGQAFRKTRRSLGLAARTKVTRLATEGEKVFPPA